MRKQLKRKYFILSISSFAVLVFLFYLLVSNVSGKMNIFSSSSLGIAFRIDSNENVEYVDSHKVILYCKNEPTLVIEVYKIQDSSFTVKPILENDVAKLKAISITKESFFRPEAVDHFCRIDSVIEYTSKNNLRVLTFYRTEVSESWGKNPRINKTWEASPEYFIDFEKKMGSIVYFHWIGSDSLAVTRVSRLIETVTHFK